MKLLFIISQYLVPQHLLSRLVGKLADSTVPWVKNTFINAFIKHYQVDMSEAREPDPALYPSFNAFFTRPLKEDARAIADEPGIVCPSDGAISEIGPITHGRILQAKGQTYSCSELLGGDASLAAEFDGGQFVTVYLSPKDYHRVHMPCAGQLRRTIYVPGDLFSVNQATAENVPRLFARNERLVSVFDTDQGAMASVMVGAMIVAGIDTVWAGQVAPPRRTLINTDFGPTDNSVALERGAEMGRFHLGSTVILLFPKDAIEWLQSFSAGDSVRMGELLGRYTH